MNPDRLESILENAGHVHAFLDSGAEAKLSKHDTFVQGETVTIDSKEGHWTFPVDKIESVDKEPSELLQAEEV